MATESLRGTVPQQPTATGDASRSVPTSPDLNDLARRMAAASRGVLASAGARVPRQLQREVNATMLSPTQLRNLRLSPESINLDASSPQQRRGNANSVFGQRNVAASSPIRGGSSVAARSMGQRSRTQPAFTQPDRVSAGSNDVYDVDRETAPFVQQERETTPTATTEAAERAAMQQQINSLVEAVQQLMANAAANSAGDKVAAEDASNATKGGEVSSMRNGEADAVLPGAGFDSNNFNNSYLNLNASNASKRQVVFDINNRKHLPSLNFKALVQNQMMPKDTLFGAGPASQHVTDVATIQEFLRIACEKTRQHYEVSISDVEVQYWFGVNWINDLEGQLRVAIVKTTQKGADMYHGVLRVIFDLARKMSADNATDVDVFNKIVAEMLQHYINFEPQILTCGLTQLKVDAGTTFPVAMAKYRSWIQASLSIDPEPYSERLRVIVVKHWIRDQFNTLYHLVCEHPANITALELLNRLQYNIHGHALCATGASFDVSAVMGEASSAGTSNDNKAASKRAYQASQGLAAGRILLNELSICAFEGTCNNCNQSGHMIANCPNPYNHANNMTAAGMNRKHAKTADEFEALKTYYKDSFKTFDKAVKFAGSADGSADTSNGQGKRQGRGGRGYRK